MRISRFSINEEELQRLAESFDPRRPDFTPYGLTCVRWRPSPMDRPDHHNEIEMNLIKSGSLTYLLGGQKVSVESGRLGVFWGAIPHQIIDCSDPTSYYVATIPLACCLQWRLPDLLLQPLLHGQLVQVEGKAFDGSAFEIWEDDLHAERDGAERTVLLEMQARLLRLACDLSDRGGRHFRRKGNTTVTDSGLSKVEKIACYIAQHYTDQLSVEDIAKVVGLHPNYATGLFSKTFGTSFVRYLTQHRVSHAQRLLVTSDCTMANVAFNSGFNSISRFNDAFRQICGCSPREYRNTHQFA